MKNTEKKEKNESLLDKFMKEVSERYLSAGKAKKQQSNHLDANENAGCQGRDMREHLPINNESDSPINMKPKVVLGRRNI